jgi:hypothetical protein
VVKIELPAPSQELVAVFDADAPADHWVYVDGSFREGDMVPAKFVPADSEEAKYGYVRHYDPLISDWYLGEVVLFELNSTAQFATAKQAGGPFPAFSGAEDTYWKPAEPPVVAGSGAAPARPPVVFTEVEAVTVPYAGLYPPLSQVFDADGALLLCDIRLNRTDKTLVFQFAEPTSGLIIF